MLQSLSLYFVYRLVRGTRERLQALMSNSKLNLNKGNELIRILLDLVQYQDDEILQGSLQLLDKYFTTEAELFLKARQTELLITERSIELYNRVERSILSRLREFLDKKNVMDALQASLFAGYSPLEELTGSCWIEGEVLGFEPHQQNQKIIYNFGKGSTLCKLTRVVCGVHSPVKGGRVFLGGEGVSLVFYQAL